MLSGRKHGATQDPVRTEQIQLLSIHGGVPTLRIIDLAEYRRAIGGGGIVVVELVRAIIGQLDLILRFVKILRFAQDDRGDGILEV